jgi:hypothetical protein
MRGKILRGCVTYKGCVMCKCSEVIRVESSVETVRAVVRHRVVMVLKSLKNIRIESDG